jgi:hypothetical protein
MGGFFGGGWTASPVNVIGSGVTVTAGTITASGGGGGNWTATPVSTVGSGLTVTAGTITASGGSGGWNAGTVSAIDPATLALVSGTLFAVGVNQTITANGTTSVNMFQTGNLIINSGTSSAIINPVGTVPSQKFSLLIEQGATVQMIGLGPDFVFSNQTTGYASTAIPFAIDILDCQSIDGTYIAVKNVQNNYNVTVVPNTWNPSDTAGNGAVFSNGNLTINATNGSAAWSITRSKIARAGGKRYTEHVIVRNGSAGGSNGDWAVGVANSGQTLNSNLGNPASGSGGYYPLTGLTYFNGATGTIATGAAGNTVRFAIDLGSQLLWYAINGGTWNNNGSADPVAEIGGISFSSITGPYFLAFAFEAADAEITSNFGGTSFTYSVPTGYTAGW